MNNLALFDFDGTITTTDTFTPFIHYAVGRFGVDLIGTEVEVHKGIVTGRYMHGDCTGLEKARRIREKYDLQMYEVVYAYGDTKEDVEMLRLANKKYFRWREVSDPTDVAASYTTS